MSKATQGNVIRKLNFHPRKYPTNFLATQAGPKFIVLTSMEFPENNSELVVFASVQVNEAEAEEPQFEQYTLRIPKIAGSYTGTGDLFAALFLGFSYLHPADLALVIEKTTAAIQSVLARTLADAGEGAELLLIQSRTDLVDPTIQCRAVKVVSGGQQGCNAVGSTCKAARRHIKIGIISGSGPDAGVNVLQKLLVADKQCKVKLGEEGFGSGYTGDKDAPNVLLAQCPDIGGPHGFWDLFDEGSDDYKRLWGGFTDTITMLANAGVDCLCVPCNTLHILEPKLRAWISMQDFRSSRSGGPPAFVSMIDASHRKLLAIANAETEAAAAAAAAGHGTDDGSTKASSEPVTPPAAPTAKLQAFILGTMVTTDLAASPYGQLAGNADHYTLVAPEESIRERLQKLIIDTKTTGPGDPANRNEFWDILQKILGSAKSKSPGQVGKVVMMLACSELPILVSDSQVEELAVQHGCLFMDPNEALCEWLLDQETTTPHKNK
jgi:aspartate/glutamate racemase